MRSLTIPVTRDLALMLLELEGGRLFAFEKGIIHYNLNLHLSLSLSLGLLVHSTRIFLIVFAVVRFRLPSSSVLSFSSDCITPAAKAYHSGYRMQGPLL